MEDWQALGALLSRAEEDGAAADAAAAAAAAGAGAAAAAGGPRRAAAKSVLGQPAKKSALPAASAPRAGPRGDDIWAADELDEPHVAALKADDGRRRPEFDIVYKQSVGAETVYLGLDDVDPSSNCCQEIVVKVRLPGQRFADLDLDVKRQSMVVTSPDFRLATYLPYPVDADRGSAKWLVESATLSVTLPIIPE